MSATSSASARPSRILSAPTGLGACTMPDATRTHPVRLTASAAIETAPRQVRATRTDSDAHPRRNPSIAGTARTGAVR
ncbi:hypothetical protein ABZZ04_29545 [Streptomyces sp. NPDC006435]|uniref:hypothetical protein n=1 Tax=Streptomyces sp. NPDC006435 TaxID=3154300 RepID=UPI0033BF9DB4